MTTRSIARLIPSIATTDGAGVRIQRSIGAAPALRLDPFLMLDEFFSDNPDDYIAGFPSHPHRGFETVTYMLDGHMLHQDHLGNRGNLRAGDVQWMTAARGIIHSEMPQQSEGRMRGFQLWLNLPAAEKMLPAAYRDVAAAEIPRVAFAGGTAKVISGTLVQGEQVTVGPVGGGKTEPLYLDVVLEPGAVFEAPVPAQHNGFLYLYEGGASVDGQALKLRTASVLTAGDRLKVIAGAGGASIIVLMAKPLNEPVVQYGPFVMNTRDEIEQAMADYREGRLTA